MLGAERDVEADGQANDGADEDGIAIPITAQVGKQNQPISIVATGGKLDAWIDFDGDGFLGGAGEQIFDSYLMANGINPLAFDVPSWRRRDDFCSISFEFCRESWSGGFSSGR